MCERKDVRENLAQALSPKSSKPSAREGHTKELIGVAWNHAKNDWHWSQNTVPQTIVNAQKKSKPMPNDVEEGEEVVETKFDPVQWRTEEDYNLQDIVSY